MSLSLVCEYCGNRGHRTMDMYGRVGCPRLRDTEGPIRTVYNDALNRGRPAFQRKEIGVVLSKAKAKTLVEVEEEMFPALGGVVSSNVLSKAKVVEPNVVSKVSYLDKIKTERPVLERGCNVSGTTLDGMLRITKVRSESEHAKERDMNMERMYKEDCFNGRKGLTWTDYDAEDGEVHKDADYLRYKRCEEAEDKEYREYLNECNYDDADGDDDY